MKRQLEQIYIKIRPVWVGFCYLVMCGMLIATCVQVIELITGCYGNSIIFNFMLDCSDEEFMKWSYIEILFTGVYAYMMFSYIQVSKHKPNE